MKKVSILLILFFLFPLIAIAQSEANIDSLIIIGKHQLHQAVHKWTDTALLGARAYFERLLTDHSKTWLVHYYIGLADYRLASYFFATNNTDQAKQYIDDGIEHLKKCLDAKEKFADAHSLLSSLYGNKIGMNPFLGMTLGPKSGKEMGKAMSIQSNNPRNHLLAGWGAYYTPKMFGGGKDKAENYFQQAIASYETFQVSDPILPDWGHEEAYAWLGIINTENEQYNQARQNFKQALQIFPEYGWVKHVLLPNLDKKISSNN